ncbi:MAG: hypothetical protein JEZ06_03155 [Anaerolineaceae bacterium]|nr:hypothetical protein [Anaerolineaceae bacterium]
MLGYLRSLIRRKSVGFCFLSFLLFLCACCELDLQGNDAIQPKLSEASLQVVVLEDRSGCEVSGVPGKLGFDDFYKKYCDAGGIPVISSENVRDLALQQAYYIIMNMLAPIPEVRQELIANGAYFAIIGIKEQQTTLPEYAHLDSDYWDQRARGLGGSRDLPITSVGEENLLCMSRMVDGYRGESVAVHEFAHTISLMGLKKEDFEILEREFNSIYESAIAEGLWYDTYAGSNAGEYWAEGVQTYFNTNLSSEKPDGVHNHVNTREELAGYDPALYAFISAFFHDFEWTPICPE